MQQAHVQERVEYAGLGHRAAAVILDTLIVYITFTIVLDIGVAAGWIDLGFDQAALVNAFTGMLHSTPGSAQQFSHILQAAPSWIVPVEFALIFLYFTLFELRGATPGKRIFRMTVARVDGTPPSPAAIIIRNLVRLLEMYLLYIPSAVSCLVSAKNERLGDYAAHTVVLRRSPGAAGGRASGPGLPGQPPAGAYPAPPAPSPAQAAQARAAAPSVPEALAALKSAALAVRGAHLNYLRFSERELARNAQEGEYTPEYEAAWYTLADSVMTMQHAYAEATVAATVTGTSIRESTADQPDLTYLFAELEPYLEAGSDEEVHEAYLRVARSEAPA